tara:strand:- start:473 stop:1447 length:975 start_codon:yes stop_codon:yes gene_type:complete
MPKFRKKDWSSVVKAMKAKKKGGFKDERFYKPEYKKDGTFRVIIRFLPAPDVDVPIVGTYQHFFKGDTGVYYTENCPTTIGGKCPACEDNSFHWNKGEEDFVRNRKSKRNLKYKTNIMVIKDDVNPDNEGKQFLFECGKKIYDKVMDLINDKDIVPWDIDDGVNFIYKAKKVRSDGNIYPDYSTSQFSQNEDDDGNVTYNQTSLEKYGNIDEIEEGLYEIGTFIAKDNYKPYDELKAKFKKAIGEDIEDGEFEEAGDETPEVETPAPEPTKTKAKTKTKSKAKSKDKEVVEESSTEPEEFDEGTVFAEDGSGKSFFDQMNIEEE